MLRILSDLFALIARRLGLALRERQEVRPHVRACVIT
jgi:hypothetical protein